MVAPRKTSPKTPKKQVIKLPGPVDIEVPDARAVTLYAGLAGLAALEVVEWPVTLVVAAAHWLATSKNKAKNTTEKVQE